MTIICGQDPEFRELGFIRDWASFDILSSGPDHDGEELFMRIMVVSPVRLFRDCLAAVLGSMQPVPEVVAAVSITALHHRSSSEPPDVVLVDVTQDIGMEEVALVAAQWRNLPLLALGLLERRDEVVRHGRAGFVGYVARDATIEDLQSAISDAVAGRMRCPAEISGGLIRALFNRAHPSPPGHVAPSLSKRETEVLQMIGRGLSNKEIARDLDLSLSTIKCHVHNVLTKLGVGHRSHAMHKVRAEPWIGARL